MENRILELRKERNMTQMSLSTSIHVSQETISAYETGRHDPTAENLIRIANFFQVSVDYLLRRSDCRIAQSYDQLSPEDAELLSLFHNASPLIRQRVIGYLQGVLSDERDDSSSSL